MTGPRLRFGWALLFLGLSGYISLSQEILWYRIISYATGGAPHAFAFLLGSFLFGLAIGAFCGENLNRSPRWSSAPLVPFLFLASGAAGYFTVPATANAFVWLGSNAVAYACFGAALVAFPSGALFPVLCDRAIEGTDVGGRLGWLYLVNIIGATLGPLFTIFVLMDVLTLPQLVTLVSGLAAAASALSLLLPASNRARLAMVGALSLCTLMVAFGREEAYRHLLEKLHFHEEYSPAHPYSQVVESRSGIVAMGGPEGPEVVYGGGVYDGGFNLDAVSNTNGIQRVMMLFAMHRGPKEVLNIGLSSGSWAQVLAADPQVEKLTVVEINPGYLPLIRRHSEHAALLSDKRVELFIDDGRRWLKRNPSRTFDMIVMNTSFHWRAHATLVLSEEFFRLCKAHLKPGGLVFMNTTAANEVNRTLAQVFRHTTRVEGFAAGSDSPFDMTYDERRAALLRLTIGDRPLLSKDEPSQAAVLDALARRPLFDDAEALRARTELSTITDDNMAVEYKPVSGRAPAASTSRLKVLSWLLGGK